MAPPKRRPKTRSLALGTPKPLRGEAKLGPALEHFGIDVTGRIALDVGAAAGGFTRVLLAAGAARVYAVDAGHGQLLGSLRQDERVANLEHVNLGQLTHALVPDEVSLLTIDVSYLSLTAAVAQLTQRLRLAPGAELVGLVKPMFELRLAEAPRDMDALLTATDAAVNGVTAAGWRVLGTMESPVTGANGAVEALLHARLEA